MKTRILKTKITTLFAAIIIPLFSFANTPDTAKAKSIFEVLNHKEMLEITMEADFTTLNENRNTVAYLPGTISFEDKKELSQNWNIKIRPRGKYRRRICSMPPLKLKFKKSDLEAAGLASYNDLKLVTHCTDNRSESKHLLIKEYLAYELYNELTPNSFRVQLVKINYIDTNTGEKTKNFGFLIEDTDELAARMEAEEVDNFGLKGKDLHKGQEKIMSVFQYMIGNEDWNVALSKNLKFFKKGGDIFPVPYDFDFSGLVNAPYARPNSNFGLSSVQDRVFFGAYFSEEELHSTRSYFRSKKSNLYKKIKGLKSLSNVSRNDVVYYLDTFFEGMDNFVVKEKQLVKMGMTPVQGLTK